MTFNKLLLTGAIVVSAIASTAAQASVLTGSFDFTIETGATGGAGFSTLPGITPFTGSTASATFKYTGALNFNNSAPQNSGPSGDLNSALFSLASISGYSGGGISAGGGADYSSVGSFLTSSGSASGYQYASFYKIDLGVLAAGTILTITHDDGASVFQGATQFGPTVSGPTAQVTDVVTVKTTGDTFLYYSRQNGTPSILGVDALAPAVPEPSTWAMMILGFAGVGFMAYRRKRQVAALRVV